MNLAQLYYFKKLAELQHYAKASKQLFITQPALSLSIASLEEELGISLFEKEGRNVRLTKYGREFYQYVQNALNELDKGIAIAKEYAGELTGTIDIGCIYTILGDFLPNLLAGFTKEKGPQIKYNIYQGLTVDIIAKVKSGEYDVGFCSYMEDTPDLVFEPVLTQPLVAVVSTTHPLAKESSILFEQLRGYPLITYRMSAPIGRRVHQLLEAYALEADYNYDDEIILGGMATTTGKVAIMLSTPASRQVPGLVPITLPQVPNDFRWVRMVYSTKHYKSRTVESFLQYVRQHVAQPDLPNT